MSIKILHKINYIFCAICTKDGTIKQKVGIAPRLAFLSDSFGSKDFKRLNRFQLFSGRRFGVVYNPLKQPDN